LVEGVLIDEKIRTRGRLGSRGLGGLWSRVDVERNRIYGGNGLVHIAEFGIIRGLDSPDRTCRIQDCMH
jgi:hypothetical protein